ncbi:MAG: hypothetical protein WCK39_04430 [Methanomassiliicoccales archaeon]
MRIARDDGATGDVMETLLAVMIVSAGLLLLTTALPSLLSDPSPVVQRSDDVTSIMIEDGILDLARAERMVHSLPEGTGVRLIASDGTSLSILQCVQSTDRDRFVTRTPVLVRTATADFPAILEVTCGG